MSGKDSAFFAPHKIFKHFLNNFGEGESREVKEFRELLLNLFNFLKLPNLPITKTPRSVRTRALVSSTANYS